MEYFQSMPDPKNRPTKRCKGLSTIFSITCGFKDLRTSYPYTTYFQETTEIYNSTQLGFRLKTLTIKTPLASFWCLYCYLWTYFTPCSSVSIVNFEHVIAGWVGNKIIRSVHGTHHVLRNFSIINIYKNQKILNRRTCTIQIELLQCRVHADAHVLKRLLRIQNTTAGYLFGRYVKMYNVIYLLWLPIK